MEAGLDSLGAVELRNQLAAHHSLELPPTVTFDYPTVAALADYIAQRIGPADSVAMLDRMPSIRQAVGSTKGTAVIGISCR